MGTTQSSENKIVMNEYVLKKNKGLFYWHIKSFETVGVQAAFFQRKGGISCGAFRSLNLDYNCGDDDKAVAENRNRIIAALQLQSKSLVLCDQIHSTKIITVKSPFRDPQEGSRKIALKQGDALVTQMPGITLCVKTADCMPILLTDVKGDKIAAVHAGWRGLLNGIIGKTISKLEKLYQLSVNSLHVALGPCIGPEVFEVSHDILKLFKKKYPESVRQSKNALYGLVDLKKIAFSQLEISGVSKTNIVNIPACTFTEKDDYFSYRREKGRTGRMFSVITIKNSPKII